MKCLTQQLQGDFVIMDLGSSVPANNSIYKKLARALTIIEIDALRPDDSSDKNFYKRIKFKKAVSGIPGKRVFYERSFFQCSSFLRTNEQLPEMYGIEEPFKVINEIELEAATVEQLLAAENISKIDFFKTDLEGLDFEILKSSLPFVTNSLVVQSELRFQPFYEGEPHFYEVCQFLNQLNFELIYIFPEVWKYKSSNQNLFRDGRLVWGDFIFFKDLAKTLDKDDPEAYKLICKQVIIAKALGLNSQAEYLFEKFISYIPPSLIPEMRSLLKMRPSFNLLLIKAMNTFSKVKGFGLLRNFFKYLHKLTSVELRFFKQWTSI